LDNFPQTGRNVTVRWAEPHQNFMIAGASQNPASAKSATLIPLAATFANLESPQPGSFESGVGLIRGWVCQANAVEVQIDDGERQKVAYGTTRNDTIGVCGDANNGFGYTFNWNTLEQRQPYCAGVCRRGGVHQRRFHRHHAGGGIPARSQRRIHSAQFPQAGRNVTVRWAEPHQNFVITQAQ
jgi:hypothetical protein